MPNISDDTRLLLFALAGLLSAATFTCLYLQEKRRAPEQKTPLRGWVAYLLYVFLIAYAIMVCLGSAVAFDTGNSQFLIPVFTYGLAVAAALLWRRAKNVRQRREFRRE